MLIAGHEEKTIDVARLLALFAQAAWTRDRTAAELEAMLEGSWLALGAWDGERLVGFARAISDGVFRAAIEDVIVDAAYRGDGVGSRLIEGVLGRLPAIEEVSLTCRPELVSWYGRFGFEPGKQPTMYVAGGRALDR